jgi:hypothetical protein
LAISAQKYIANAKNYRNDATAGWTIESMKAAVEHSWPSFAHEVISTEEWQKRLA